tara:strand:- start:1058 stop:1432 length:375 start_codon:yes stop_codon:yes gene_type:complete
LPISSAKRIIEVNEKKTFVKLNFVIPFNYMYQNLLYLCCFVSFISFFLALIACARVGKFIKSSERLDWNDVANLTGDIATVKKTIQTLNNRVNGMHSPKIAEQELMMELLKNQPKQQSNGMMGG